MFSKGTAHAVVARGREQLDRLAALIQATDDVLQSPQLAADTDAIELTGILQAGRTSLQQVSAALSAEVEAWEAQTRVVTRAQDAFNFRRSDGIKRLGVVMGELRALLDGNSRAAYAYTQRRERTGTGTGAAAADDDDDVPPDPGDDGNDDGNDVDGDPRPLL